jgi:arsenate reductase (thioredoxin)
MRLIVKRILFACVGNSFRSQIAEGFARVYAREGSIDVRSGGTRPFGFVSPSAVRLMLEKGIDISKQTSKPLDLAFAERADAFVTLCGPLDDACPARLAQRAIDWNIPDPDSMDLAGQKRIRDEIEGHVKSLLRSWGLVRERA